VPPRAEAEDFAEGDLRAFVQPDFFGDGLGERGTSAIFPVKRRVP